jgi:spermidine synthase
LEDPRVTVAVGDLFDVLAAERFRFHLILLDVDNGPADLAVESNRRLYEQQGIERIRLALRDRGVLVVWAATPALDFRLRLEGAGFGVEVIEVPVAANVVHTMYLARLV